MNFNDHSRLEGKHAFLSPSSYHWVNYDDQKLFARFRSHQNARRGTRLHNFAKEAITLGVKLPNTKDTLNLFVNDAISFKMDPEVMLYYSPYCFGQTDAICFRKGKLRIHDLKTGIIKSSFMQLVVYAAIFCLEYGIDPYEIEIELRIYQRGEILIDQPDGDHISRVMERIIDFDQKIQEFEMGVS